MNTTWTLLPICRLNGQKQEEIPGLAIFSPPERSTRSRREDTLLIYLAVAGTARVEDAAVRQMVATAADTFYQTSGSVTSGLRAAANLLNERLWAHNQASPGQFVLGRAVVAAARGDRLYLLVSGPVEIFALGATGRQVFSEDVRAGRGMGASQALPHYLASLPLHPPMKIAFCAYAPAEWREFFENEQVTTSAAVIADSLWQIGGQDLHAALLDIAGDASKAELPETGEAASSSLVDSADENTHRDAAGVRLPRLSLPEIPPEQRRELAATTLQQVQRMRASTARWRTTLHDFILRLLPEGDPVTLSRWMIVLAILLPLLVSGVAAGVYLQRGLRNQALALYQQADALAVQARMETNPVLQRETWRGVLTLLEQADALMPLDESAALRQDALSALDALDGVLRLVLEDAGLKLPETAQIIAISAHADAAFLLDGASGQVYRAGRTTSGYRLSPGFRCGSGLYEGAEIDQPVAIQALPAGMSGEVLLVDADGDLLWCDINGQPVASRLPDTGRGTLQVSLARWQDGYLYVLDREARAVWIFPAEADGQFLVAPLFFFDVEVPQLDAVRDIAVYGGELYLLNADSTLTVCSYSRVSGVPNRCETAVTLEDRRPGYSPAARLPDTDFTSLLITRPPNMALWLMDGSRQTLYRFSPQLRLLQNLLRPRDGSPAGQAPWSAFTVTPDYVLLVASGNHLYFAAHIP